MKKTGSSGGGSDKKDFLLDLNKHDLLKTYHNKEPRDAALKAASDGYQSIILLEYNTRKLHVFRGKKEKIPYSKLSSFQEQKNIQFRPNVIKLGVDQLNDDQILLMFQVMKPADQNTLKFLLLSIIEKDLALKKSQK